MKIILLLILLSAEVPLTASSKPIDFGIPDSVKLSLCLEKAKKFSDRSMFDSAIFYQDVASNIYLHSGDTVKALECDYDMIKVLGLNKEDIRSLNLLNKAGVRYEKWFRKHPIQDAEYQYKMGEKFTDILKFDSALISYNRSLPLWFSNGKDSVKQIKDVFKAISYVYSSTGKYDSAILYLRKALFIYSSKYGLQNRVAVNTYLSLGNAYFYKGEINKGLDLFRKALKTSLSIPDASKADLAWTYNSIGISYYLKKDYNLALVYIHKALSLFSKIYGEKCMEVAWCYNNIGICYQEMKKDEQAYLYQDKALKIRLSLVGENHPDVASSYNNLGVICEDEKDYVSELNFFKKALDIRIRIFNEINQDIALTYLNIGSTFKLMHQYDSAFYYYEKSLSVFLNHYTESTGYISQIYIRLSQINLAQNNYKLAFENIGKSLAILVPEYISKDIADNPEIDDIYFYPDMISALENKANALQVYYDKKSKDPADLEKCLSVYKLIADINDKFSRQLREEGSKLLAEGNAREIFAEAVKVSTRLFDIRKDEVYAEMAFYYAEKARASVLFEAMEETNMMHFAGIPDSLLTLVRKLRVDKTDCDLKIKELKQKKELTGDSLMFALENEYFALTNQYQQIIDSIEIKYPVFQDLQKVPRAISCKDIMAGLDDRTALIEYFICNDSLFIFAFNQKDFRLTVVSVDPAIIKKFYDYPRDIRRLKTDSFITNSNLLYKNLIKPVKDMFEDCERLIIVPDGQLFYIPFETLIAKKSNNLLDFSDLDYLIRHYDISYHYSGNLWLNSQNLVPEKTKTLDAFIGFAPVFKNNYHGGNIISANLFVNDSLNGETVLRSATSGGRKFNELVYTQQEISSIIDLFARNNLHAKGYLFAEASEENFKKQSGKYKYVHIASHGFCDDKEPALSGIAFYQTKEDSSESEDLPEEISEKNEGILFAGEIYNLKLNADLVVLSSCESGAGTLMKGEGMMGLSRGFLFAGVPNIVYSLWKIGDLNTSQLMEDFYKYVLQKNNYAHALRLAKLNMIDSEATAFPKFWSSFELVGK
jgi:CHAT domain-containing protein